MEIQVRLETEERLKKLSDRGFKLEVEGNKLLSTVFGGMASLGFQGLRSPFAGYYMLHFHLKHVSFDVVQVFSFNPDSEYEEEFNRLLLQAAVKLVKDVCIQINGD